MNTNELLESIKSAFLNQDKYMFDKYVPEFKIDGKYFADSYNQMAVEPRGDKPPRFYYNISPFDTISKTAPDQAIVFEGGKQLLNIEFTDYVKMRTAAMDTIVLEALGVKSLADKCVLLMGAGNVARHTVKILKNKFPDFGQIDVITKSGKFDELQTICDGLGVSISRGSLDDIHDYDIILCHTNTEVPVLAQEHRDKLKAGAIITTFIDPAVSNEVANEFYDATKANIIGDWEQTRTRATDFAAAVQSGLAKDQDMIMLQDLLSGKRSIDASKGYIIYRSTGTPIQNLAVLQTLLAKAE